MINDDKFSNYLTFDCRFMFFITLKASWDLLTCERFRASYSVNTTSGSLLVSLVACAPPNASCRFCAYLAGIRTTTSLHLGGISGLSSRSFRVMVSMLDPAPQIRFPLFKRLIMCFSNRSFDVVDDTFIDFFLLRACELG